MSGAVAVIGAGGGIGGAIARRLDADGWRIIALGRRIDPLEVVSRETPIACDAADPAAVAHAFATLQDRYGALSGAVFSIAEPFTNRLTHRTDWSNFQSQVDGQLKALHLFASSALPLLRASGSGRLIVIGSEATLGAPPTKTAPYVAAKAAMTAYAQVIAQEWLRFGVRVHILAPGLVRTSLMADLPDAFLAHLAEGMPERALTRAEDVADLASFCMTPAADTLYGTPLRVSRAAR